MLLKISISIKITLIIALIAIVIGLIVFQYLAKQPVYRDGEYNEGAGGISFKYDPKVWKVTDTKFKYNTGNIFGRSWESKKFENTNSNMTSVITLTSNSHTLEIKRNRYSFGGSQSKNLDESVYDRCKQSNYQAQIKNNWFKEYVQGNKIEYKYIPLQYPHVLVVSDYQNCYYILNDIKNESTDYSLRQTLNISINNEPSVESDTVVYAIKQN